MSTNIHFEAHRDILVIKTGKQEIQSARFKEVWQTPTDVTRKIMKAKDHFQAYRDWVMEGQEDQREPLYAPGDIFHEGPIVGYETFNYGVEHLKDFDGWLKMMQEDGYEIEVNAW